MKSIPDTNDSLVLRTDFSDDPAWEDLCEAITMPYTENEFQAYVSFLSDREYEGMDANQLLSLLPKGSNHSFFFIVDKEALHNSEHTILVVDVMNTRGRTFRVIPSEMWGVQSNLAIANMDFSEFANAVDPDGVFRGFPEP